MKKRKLLTSAVAVTTALALTFTGTLAWQNISQRIANEANGTSQAGGRLHDDFGGPDVNKDIYVENFGDQDIYARVRLDEYMEIGEGAGLKNDPTNNKSIPLVQGASIDDPNTWTIHLFDSGETADYTDSNQTFHTYWEFEYGGSTVYMPTFNKNADSLYADVNGTLAGTDNNTETGEKYDDYHIYALDEEKTSIEYYDADNNTIDECGPDGGPNGTGVEGTNYRAVSDVTHKAVNTLDSTVISMADYKAKTDEEKTNFTGWVYDTDGWAYWSQAIEPDTATGLLLTNVKTKDNASGDWYYAINAIAQFVTKDDLGRKDGTGFYTNGYSAPSSDALDLLKGIGVDTDLSYTLDILNEGNSVKNTTLTGKAGSTIQLTAAITASDNSQVTGNTFTWSSDNEHITVDASSGLVTVSNDVEADDLATITLKSSLAPNTSVSVKVQPFFNSVDILDDTDASITNTTISLKAGDTKQLSYKLSSSDGTTPSGTVAFTSDNSNVTIDTSGLLTVSNSQVENSTIKVTATSDTDPVATASFNIQIANTYDIDILSGTTSVKNQTVTITDGNSVTYTPQLKVNGTVQTAGDWTVTSSNTNVQASGALTVTVPANTANNTTSTITVKNSIDDSISAAFTVKTYNIKQNIQSITPSSTSTVTIDNIEWYVLARDSSKALLLSKNVVEQRAFNSNNDPRWMNSTLRTYLNADWLNNHPTIKSKAIQTTIYTQQSYTSAQTAVDTTKDYIFLLSQADVFGTAANGSSDVAVTNNQLYTTGSKLTAPGGSWIANNSSGSATWYWSRSPRSSSNDVASVNTGGSRGNYTTADLSRGGVRPAFYYNLQ